LRDLLSLEKDFVDEPEIIAFFAVMKPLLKAAVAMHRFPRDFDAYIETSMAIKDQIVTACNQEANHPGIRIFQDIFREYPERCFQWVSHRTFPQKAISPSADCVRW